MAHIQIPDFPYSGHYYPEILEDLIQFLRANVPELTDEDPTEPHIQLLRAYALAAHINNTLLDLVANEMFLPTAKLRSSHRNLLALIGVKLKQASPASADIVYQLTRSFSSTTTILRSGSLFGTLETPDTPSVDFEVLSDVSTERTDRLGKCFAYNKTGDSYVDHTAAAQILAGSFSPTWGTAENGDALYIGHSDVLWNQLDIDIATGSSGITEGVWEYYDGNLDQGNPTSVTNLGDRLQFNVNSILGTSDRNGTTVRVRSNKTGGFEDIVSTFSGGNNLIETTAGASAFLGHATPSTSATDYVVGSEWRELSDIADNTSNLSTIGVSTVKYSLPQTLEQDWTKFTVGSGAVTASQYWIRFRVINVSTPTLPTINEIKITEGTQYQVVSVTQGRTREDNPLASSDASPNQSYELLNFPVIDGSTLKVFVTEATVEKEYSRVDNFLNSLPTDRHFTVDFDDEGAAKITFGNGTSGRIPPAGVDNIRAEYRTMTEVNGNVGSETITVNKGGAAFITQISNPRAAAGFTLRQGGSTDDLNKLKISGPASLRTLDRAVGVLDTETLALDFVAADGSSPVARALAIEEQFGPKTIGIVIVGNGGSQVQASKLQEIDDFFNGTEDVRGRILLNQQSTTSNFTEKSIDVTATVDGGELNAILTALTVLLNPLATRDDGNYIWSFGGTVPTARIIQEIMNTDPAPRNTTLTLPAADVSLGTEELPVVGTLSITINP